MRSYRDLDILKLLQWIDEGHQPTAEEHCAISERTKLDLSDTYFTALPESFGQLVNLQSLNLRYTEITTLPESFGQLAKLQSLNLYNAQITTLPESFGQLAKLQSLNLYNAKIAALPESFGQLVNLQSLNLCNTYFTALPESFGQLASLQKLDLSYTRITALPESFGQLAKLRSLDLCDTPITALPESFGQLASLQSLNLRDTPITTLPESFGQLASLQSLDLNGTQITTLPESFGQLANLQSLNLGGTRITALSESFGQLASLQNLDLGSTRIATLPESFGQLAKLQSLDIHNTLIKTLPESFGQLASLPSLDLSRTQITALPESFGQLASLQNLDLSDTPITALPESFGQLPSLQNLNLRSTQITALPESFDQLASLQNLDLSRIPISALPESFGQLPSLQTLDLRYTEITALPEELALGPLPILDRPESIDTDVGIFAYGSKLPDLYFQGKEILAEYFAKGKKQGFREAKIIFLGDGNAGKTFTVKRFLANGAPEDPEKPYSLGQTHGVCPYDYPHKKGGEDFLVHLWDFGGQELLHAMHRCFLTENTVYVLMVSTRDSEHTRRLRYWLQSVRPFARGAEILILVNVFDGEGQADIDEIGLQNEFKQYLRLRFETLSVKDCTQEEFRVRIMEPLLRKAEAAEEAAGLHPAPFLRVRDRVKRALAERRDETGKEQGWIDAATYLECCRAEGIEEAKRQAALLRYFTNLGVCFSTIGPTDPGVPADCRLIRPIWLTNALYAVIEECRPIKGWLTQAMMETCLGDEAGKGRSEKYTRVAPALRYDSIDCGYVLRVAEGSALAYRDPEDPEDVFLPATCRYADKKPEDLQMPEQPAYSLIYELECPYLPETAVQRLMLEFLREGFHRPVCWRGGFRFENKDCSGILDTVEDDRVLRLTLWSQGETPVYQHLGWFRSRLEQALDRRDGVKEYISTGRERYLLQRLLNAKHNRIERVASALERTQTYTVSELLGSIREEGSRDGTMRSGDTYNNYFYGNENAVAQGSGGTASIHKHAPERRTDLRWTRFAANFPDTEKVFELLCMDLFALDYFEKGAIFPAIPNNPGLECHPQTAKKGEFTGKRMGFQAKFFTGSLNYADIKDSVEKAIKYYHEGREAKDQLEVFVLYCNQKPSEGDESGNVKGNQTFHAAKDLLEKAGIHLKLLAGQDLLNRIRECPQLVKRYFYV